MRCLRSTLLALILLPVLASAQPVPCVGGFAGEFACRDVDLLARLPLNATPEFSQSSSDIWGWTDPVTGTEYAIINQYNYTAFVDLSDPTEPVVVGTLDAPSQAVARDAKVYADHVFLSTDSGLAPVQVFDLTRLRDVTDPPETFTADVLYTDGTDPHNIAINEDSGFAYFVLTGSGICDAGFHFVDVRDPLSPTFAGCFTYPTAEFHDAQCVNYDGPDADYSGREMCFGPAGSGGVLTIVDVTDKADPVLVSETPYPNAAYTHQGWLTEDGRYFLLNDEFDEGSFGINTRTVVFDVSDLDEPAFFFEYVAPTTSTDHNLFVHDGYVYQANYTAGLRILDLAEIDGGALTEAAFFDTLPENDETGFDGAFGVYPFFESGIVVVSDMRRGLFVLQPRLGTATGIGSGTTPGDGASLAVYPNPLGPRATVELTVPTAQSVAVAVFDVLGRRVVEVYEGSVSAGTAHRLAFDAAVLPVGSYVVRVTGETFEASQSVTLMR
ncbi:MAG: choice-of-anchor B family protein [Rhodothermales bacterium]